MTRDDLSKRLESAIFILNNAIAAADSEVVHSVLVDAEKEAPNLGLSNAARDDARKAASSIGEAVRKLRTDRDRMLNIMRAITEAKPAKK